MENKLSILPSKTQLTQYKHGVKFTVKTHGQDYEVDADTAQKLSDVLIAGGDTKFVKIKTEQGQVVLNVASIMAVSLDETMAKETIAFMKRLPELGVDYSDKDQMYSFYRGRRLEGGKHYVDQPMFNYYYDQEFAK